MLHTAIRRRSRRAWPAAADRRREARPGQAQAAARSWPSTRRRRRWRWSSRSLVEAQTAYAAALAPLTKSEIHELARYLYPVMVGQNTRRPHAERPRHRPPAVRPDGEDGPRRHASPRPRPWCRSPIRSCSSSSSSTPTRATSRSRASAAAWWPRSTRPPAPSSSAARSRTPISSTRCATWPP